MFRILSAEATGIRRNYGTLFGARAFRDLVVDDHALRAPSWIIPRQGFIIPKMGMKRTSRNSGRRSAGLADALFAKVQQRVLGVLFGNPGRSFYANEVIGLARSGTGAVQRELAPRARHSPWQAKALSGKSRFADIQRSTCVGAQDSGVDGRAPSGASACVSKHPAAFIYGSIAKGEDTASSDIDLMVVSDRLAYADLFAALEKASTELGRKIAPTIYSSKEFTKRVKQGNAFVKRVLAQPKLWLIGTDSDLAT